MTNKTAHPAPAGAAAPAPSRAGRVAEPLADLGPADPREAPTPRADREPTPPARREPPAGATFTHSLRTSTSRWWAPLVGIVGGLLLFLVGALVIGTVVGVVATVVLAQPGALAGMTPTTYAVGLGTLVLFIPIAVLLQRTLHGQGAGYLLSVQGRMRLSWLTRTTLVLLLAFALSLPLLSLLGPDQGERSPQWVVYLVLGLVLMPFQAAAEEVFFRGYVQRAVGSWFAEERVAFGVGALVSATLFALAHLATDPWLNAYYVVFGLSLSWLARATGGIEAGIAVHVANNVVAGALGALTSDPNAMVERGVGAGGPFLLAHMAAIVALTAALTGWSRRRRLPVRVAHERPVGAGEPDPRGRDEAAGLT